MARRGAVYCVRFRIPADLTSKLGMVEFRRSLQTREPDEARRLCLRATSWFRTTVERLRTMSDPTRADLENAARTHFSTLAADLDRPRDFPSDPVEHQHAEAYRTHLQEERLIALSAQLSENQYDGHVELNARAITEILGLKYDQLSQQQRVQISQLAVRAEVAQTELYRHQLTDPLKSFEPTDKLFGISASAPDHGSTASAGQAGPTHPLKKLTDTFIAAKRAKGRRRRLASH